MLTNGLVVLYLWAIGRPFIAPTEPLKLFSDNLAAANSLYLSDPYSLLHVIFGIGLFLYLDWMKPFWPTREKLIVAVLGSAIWEVVENTPYVVGLFNDTSDTAAYNGDSVANSIGDTISAVIGFLFANRTGRRVSLFVAFALESIVTVWIGDGIVIGTLRLLGLYPI
ncbi:DUF2585 family protein [Fulvimarina pelagi]|uniref:DUF2585 family protein n=1 Tax=Fulvimarina pelagi TaxID=217511 RepID=UPI000319D5BD|nr:DUF2585 family protein [Fulvimarina pelagi]